MLLGVWECTGTIVGEHENTPLGRHPHAFPTHSLSFLMFNFHSYTTFNNPKIMNIVLEVLLLVCRPSLT